MSPELLHIYGPLSINGFGLTIAIGIAVFTWLVYRDPVRKTIMTGEQLIDVILIGTGVGVLCARIVCVLGSWDNTSHWTDFFKIWDSGFTVLGAIIGLALFLPCYFYYFNIPIVRSLDLFSLYAPLLQAISRFGCLFVGCCFGKPTSLPWAIVYTNPDVVAPLHVALHPVQVYSSILLTGIFVLLYKLRPTLAKKPGQLFLLYLTCAGIERCCIDFLRDDQEFLSIPLLNILSLYQWIALSLAISAATLFIYRQLKNEPF
ncbi:MAG: prolipoprotein diacylglyceryl transferase [Candidatus Babeliales bacterium]